MSASCEPCEPLDLGEEWKLLDALPVVDTVIPDVHIHKQRKTQTQRVTCTLWCGHRHDAGDLRRPAVMCNQSTVPSVEHAVRALRLKIEAAHGGCLAAAEAARAAAAAPATRQPADAFQAMMRTARSRRAEAAAKDAEKVAAALRAAADAAAAEERQHASGSQQDEERAKRAQTLGHKLARKLKVGDWVAVQARERWSTKEVVHYRAGTLAHAPSFRLLLHH